jgi:pimeloyl-ACP methyl ester carboxylesterase
LLWFVIIGGVDFVAHCQFTWYGFQHHAMPISSVFSVIPPRLQSIFARHRSPSNELSYWYRPHTAVDKLPVVFLHGIGVGLWTYVPFLAKLNNTTCESDQIGVIAVEILPISFRLTKAPLEKLDFLGQMEVILESHGWDKFVVATHSYGSVLGTHMIKSPVFGPRIEAIVLTDPVSIMLHQPDVAYNFTRRKPRHGNEWQLWYFASMDPGVAHALGRHFFWRENIIWKEELLNLPEASTSDSPVGAHGKQRKVAVSLSGCDLIVDTFTVAQYLAEGEDWIPGKAGAYGQTQSSTSHLTKDGIEVLWFPKLDHAQIFDNPKDQERVCSVLRQYCVL